MEKKPKGRGRGANKGNPRGGSAGESSVGNNIKPEVRFQEACAQIQANSKRFAPQVSLEDSDSSDSQDGEAQKDILDKVLRAYEGGDHPARTQQFLIDSLTSGATVCLICIESVKRTQAIWSCAGCYGIFHLPCVQKWAVDSIQIQNLALLDSPIPNQKKVVSWCCPKCRNEYAVRDKPELYVCFCGKKRDPPSDPWLVPHSCGTICQKDLLPLCSHRCLLLCHPGPCPPCAQTIRSSCFCGSQAAVPRRCSRKEWSCQQACGRLLECGQHKCQDPCHPGSCNPCPRQSKQSCMCAREKQLRSCASPKWQCQQVCGKQLACGQHNCSIICHQGSCGKCPREGVRKCPCGKTESILPCTEEVPNCGDTCDKTLDCGLHRCAQRCHLGPCGNCLQVIVKTCRCGAKDKSFPCFKEFLCESKCKKGRDCGRHPCSRKCCDGNCPPCEQLCGKTLRCKNHKCNSQCHLGQCYPCPLMVPVVCSCGGTKITVPCGREKATKPPRCKLSCKVPSGCHHDKREPHRCHYGLCPSCQQTCGLHLTRCQHSCPKPCHDAVRIKVKAQQKRAGPWEPVVADREEVVKQPCPPCLVPMPLKCLGAHTVQNFACSDLRPWSCGRACGRPLICGNHTCAKECHLPSEDCGGCESPCSFSRPAECRHTCSTLTCHPLPCPPCKRMESTACHCGLVTLHIVCSEWTVASAQQRQTLKCCLNRCPKQLSCSHRCPETCHPGACPPSTVCKKRVPLRCPCKRLKQEHPCNTNATPPACDAKCFQILKEEEKAKQEKELKQKEEETRLQQEEMDKYLRKMEGKKKKSRKPRTECDKQSFWTFRMKILVTFVGTLVAAVVSAYLFF